ncbi:DUF2931 family protein [Acinetobacter gerneri]|uniref:DUF2931 family protein n=2 Tax=Acinetobacter gerneri TaxID=202952 RepID=UPI003A8A6780
MARSQKIILFLCILTCAFSIYLAYRIYQGRYMDTSNDVEWGASTSSGTFTNYKDLTNAIFVDSYIVRSPVDEKMRTSFFLADGTWLRTLYGSSGSWGLGGTPLGGNPFRQPLPEILHLIFFDRYDNQFYQLIQPLPKEKIHDLFTTVHKGIADDDGGSANVYDTFDIGFAPKGWIILYAIGPGIRKEIGSWQAKKIDADYNLVIGLTMTGDMEYLKTHDDRKKHVQSALDDFKKRNPAIYKRWMDGTLKINSDWYKMLQTKFPWNLEVNAPDADWSGEYYAEYANVERYEVLDDQLAEDKTHLKAAPVKIGTWLTYKPTGVRYYVEIHMFPIPKWSAYKYFPYYQDPNLALYFKNFQELFPLCSLARNETPAHEAEFGKIVLDFDEDFKIKEAYLKRGKTIRPLDGAYEYYLAPQDLRRGKYIAEEGHPHFLTAPKIPDLTDPVFADRD